MLKQFVIDNSPNSGDVEWERAIGIGYSVISLPVAKNKLEAFRPLYIALSPNANETVIDLIPVGELLDLNRWLDSRHQGSLTFSALILLTVGFFMQLFSSFALKNGNYIKYESSMKTLLNEKSQIIDSEQTPKNRDSLVEKNGKNNGL